VLDAFAIIFPHSFAILLAMSLTITPALKDHWSWDPLLGSPWIASRDHWSPSQKVCIDEGISPWLGRKKGLRVFVLGKPHPNGIKIFILADENNYAFDFWIYRGSQPPVEELVKEFVCKLRDHSRCLLWLSEDRGSSA